MEKGSSMNIETVQIDGVDLAKRLTKAQLQEDTTLTITEKIKTSGKQQADTDFVVELLGEHASCHVTSRRKLLPGISF